MRKPKFTQLRDVCIASIAISVFCLIGFIIDNSAVLHDEDQMKVMMDGIAALDRESINSTSINSVIMPSCFIGQPTKGGVNVLKGIR